MDPQLRALLWRHLISCRRHRLRTVFFLLTPFGLLVLLLMAVMLVNNADIPELDYQATALPSSHPLAVLSAVLCGPGQHGDILARFGQSNFTPQTGFLCNGQANFARAHLSTCVQRDLKTKFKDVPLADFLFRGEILFYPKTVDSVAVMSILAAKLDSFLSLRQLMAAYTQFVANLTPVQLAAVPKVSALEAVAQEIVSALGCFANGTSRLMGRDSLDDAKVYAQSLSFQTHLVWGIVGLENLNQTVKYRLVSHTGTKSSTAALFLQDLVESALIQYQSGRSAQVFRQHRQLPRPCRHNQSIYTSVFGCLQLIFCFGFLAVSVVIASEMAYEKSAGLHEFLYISGVPNWKIRLGWTLYSLAFNLPIAMLLMVAIKRFPKGVFALADWSVVFLLLLLYAIALVAQNFLVSSIVGTPQRASVVQVILAVLPYLLPSFAGLLPQLGFSGGRLVFERLVCLSPMIAAMTGAAYIVGWEKVGVGANFSNIFDSPVADDFYSGMAEVFLWLTFDICLFSLLAWYFDKISPSKYGVQRPFYFPLQPSFWCPSKSNRNGSEEIPAGDSQNLDGICLKDLKKKYGSKVAVDGVNLHFQKGTVGVLLGHNGAGKSTTINILCGMLAPTSGSVTVGNLDVTTKLGEIRKHLGLGFCPQYDILYPDLNVAEHMIFYSKLKRLPTKETAEFSDWILRFLNMNGALKTLSNNLSGGMKRKLSIAISLIGKPQFLILDEPTSAVDPFSRRSIWDLLLSHRNKSTMLISTHHMPEAELLGDKIAIVSRGCLKCSGTTKSLKEKFGKGHKLVVSFSDELKGDGTAERITSLASFLRPIKRSPNTLEFLMPSAVVGSADFLKLLKYLEGKAKTEINVNTFGLTEPSLEDVFFEVVQERDSLEPVETPSSAKATEKLAKATEVPAGVRLILLQFYGLLVKRFHLTRRSVVVFIMQIFAPLLIVLLLLVLSKSIAKATNTGAVGVLVNPWPDNRPVSLFYGRDMTMAPLPQPYLDQILQFSVSARCLPTWPVNGQSCAYPLITELPDTLPSSGGVVTCQCQKSCPALASGLPPGQTTLPSGDVLLNLDNRNISDYILKNFDTRLVGGYRVGRVPTLPTDYFVNLGQSLLSSDPIWSQLDSQWLTGQAVNFHFVEIWAGKTFEGQQQSVSEAKFVDIRAAMLNGFNNPILRSQVPRDSLLKSGLLMYAEETNLKSNELSTTELIGGYVVSLFALYAFLIPTNPVVLFVVSDRSSCNKDLQMLMGLTTLLYWVSNFICDFLLYLISVALVIVVMAVASDSFDLDLEAALAVALLYGLNMILLCYVLSFVFNAGRNAILFIELTAIVFNITSIVLKLWSTEDWYDSVDTLLNFIPPYFASEGLFIAASYQYYNRLGQRVLDWSLLGKRFVISVIVSLALVVILMMLEKNLLQRLRDNIKKRCCCRRKKIQPDSEKLFIEAPEVDEERRRIAESTTDRLAVRNLSKVYQSGKHAVKGVSFGVRPAECFGLFGTNGAGKTSVFKMLTRHERASGGVALLNGENIQTTGQRVGYCPQDNICYDNLTGLEHLIFYARLRGILDVRGQRTELLKVLVAKLAFELQCQKLAKTLSGGNKRKLNLAVALLNFPPIVLSDEMTSGMDPAARRSAWNCLAEVIRSGSAAVVTSHSVGECEDLCDRIAIMTEGKFLAVGTVQHLKDKFGNVYTVKLSLKDDVDPNQMFQVVKRSFSGAEMVESHSGVLQVEIPSEGLLLSRLFQMIGVWSHQEGVKDFSVTQNTLERAFVNLVEGKKENLTVTRL